RPSATVAPTSCARSATCSMRGAQRRSASSIASCRTSACKIAGRLADGPPRGLGFVKQLLRGAFHPDLEEHLQLGEAVQPLCLASADHREALAAYAENRKPLFVGR